MIIPITPNIHTIPAVDKAFNTVTPLIEREEIPEETGTFLDVLTGLWDQAVEAQAAKSEDMVNIMLGEAPSLESLQVNITKAQLATELFVNIKNAAVDAYNEIMRMSI